MKLSIAIMAVPSRRPHVDAMVARLADQIRAARANGLDVVGTEIFWDTDHRGPWHGWRGAWETHRAHESTHHAVLQDDIRFCADLPATLCRMIEARPDAVVSGFLPRKSVEKADAAKVPWVRAKRFLWAQCVVLPTALGDDALAWIDAQEGTPAASGWRFHDDVRIADFLRSRKLPVYVPVPHPVEHVGDELGGSVMGHNGPAAKRRARVWLGEQATGAGHPWHDLAFVTE